ncbi:IS1 family transposase [Dysgonomonas sp. 25]|uniref:IS1 family transposase n=1 Tax=Dysgonomonas sp. 25 TaxID=2302933 RepID=UPI0013D53308|nr:IS1 family transposase [Dysgonomonas sp. 25]NDV70270.1 IS1 family transposase [Dysgonomonas sp. 25]
MICKFCKEKCIKDGFQKNGCQRYKCKSCKKKQQKGYKYHAYNPSVNHSIITYTKEGVGIRGTARLLKISTTTLLCRILSIAKNIKQPPVMSKQVYEVDEIKSFVKRKNNRIWIVYALDRKTKEVVSYNVGNRTNTTLKVVIKTLNLSNAKKIYTDKWIGYKTLIDKKIHSTFNRATNHIERHNLTLRTHLKRLTRRSICFSRSSEILSAILRIYFWG